jgi:hypothetical protein
VVVVKFEHITELMDYYIQVLDCDIIILVFSLFLPNISVYKGNPSETPQYHVLRQRAV